MDIRDRELTHEGNPLRIDSHPLDPVAPEWIRPVQNDQLFPLLRAGLKTLSHRANVGVAAASDILHIEDQHIDPRQHLGCRLAGIAVERPGLESSQGILAGANLNPCLLRAVESVLRRVEGNQIDVLSEDETGFLTRGVHAGLIGDKAHALAPQEIEIVLLQDIDSEFHGMKRESRQEKSG